jgi:hypothetical protein
MMETEEVLDDVVIFFAGLFDCICVPCCAVYVSMFPFSQYIYIYILFLD